MAGDIVKQLRDTRYPGQWEMRFEAADEIEWLRGIEKAARSYFDRYLQDEAEEEDVCFSPEKHVAARALRDALKTAEGK